MVRKVDAAVSVTAGRGARYGMNILNTILIARCALLPKRAKSTISFRYRRAENMIRVISWQFVENAMTRYIDG